MNMGCITLGIMFLCLVFSLIGFGYLNTKLIDRDLFELIKQDATYFDPKTMKKKTFNAENSENINLKVSPTIGNDKVQDCNVNRETVKNDDRPKTEITKDIEDESDKVIIDGVKQ